MLLNAPNATCPPAKNNSNLSKPRALTSSSSAVEQRGLVAPLTRQLVALKPPSSKAMTSPAAHPAEAQNSYMAVSDIYKRPSCNWISSSTGWWRRRCTRGRVCCIRRRIWRIHCQLCCPSISEYIWGTFFWSLHTWYGKVVIKHTDCFLFDAKKGE